MEKRARAVIAGVLAILAVPCPASSDTGPSAALPQGVYLWFPQPGTFPTESQCREILGRTNASPEDVEGWLRGEALTTGEGTGFYLVLSPGRMETTFSAEGDYDTGAVSYGPEANGMFPFRLEPDGEPSLTVEGLLKVAKAGYAISVALKGSPGEKDAHDRTASYCRVPERETTA